MSRNNLKGRDTMSKMQTVTEKDLRKLIIEIRREERKAVVPETIEQVKFYPEFDMKDPGAPTNIYMSGGVHRQSPVTAVYK